MQSRVKFGRFGLFVMLLGRFPTGSSYSASVATFLLVLTTLYHFVPHLTRKLLIVKRKVYGRHPRRGSPVRNTNPSSLRAMLPQGIVFTS